MGKGVGEVSNLELGRRSPSISEEFTFLTCSTC